jgi:NAD(P)-dependent dehydrogenase (short-subunit alcohol dehydrogenase family)
MTNSLDIALPLAGRRALITGASGDIGQALALGLARAGADIAVHHCAMPEHAQAVAAKIAGLGRLAHVYEGDFTQPGQARALAHAALADGPVDILLSNAAIERRSDWTAIDPVDFTQMVSVNFGAFVDLAAVLGPAMGARGWGRIVATGSVLAARPRAETLIYASLKAAQNCAVRALARELGGRGVTVNIISPGAVETERMAASYADPAFRATVSAKLPIGRPASPVDCVAPVVMLCSDAGGYITGANIPVDGGWTAGDAPKAVPA